MNTYQIAKGKYEIARKLVCLNLENSNGLEALNHLIMIRGGSKEVLMEHFKALESIFKDAIIYLEYLKDIDD